MTKTAEELAEEYAEEITSKRIPRHYYQDQIATGGDCERYAEQDYLAGHDAGAPRWNIWPEQKPTITGRYLCWHGINDESMLQEVLYFSASHKMFYAGAVCDFDISGSDKGCWVVTRVIAWMPLPAAPTVGEI